MTEPILIALTVFLMGTVISMLVALLIKAMFAAIQTSKHPKTKEAG